MTDFRHEGPASVPAEEAVKRRSRDETEARILEVAEELFATHDPDHVTVRDVAEAAGVTHALVHQYFGSKANLYSEVVGRQAPDRQSAIRQSPDFQSVLQDLIPDILDRKLHSRTMVRSAMDGMDYASLQERIDSGGMLIELARRSAAEGRRVLPPTEAMDARIVVATLIAAAYGWVAIEDWLVQICRLEDEDPEWVREQLLGMVARMADAVFAPDGASEAGADDC